MNMRYVRQIRLPEIGKKGQERLRKGKVLVIGAGVGSECRSFLLFGKIISDEIVYKCWEYNNCSEKHQ